MISACQKGVKVKEVCRLCRTAEKRAVRGSLSLLKTKAHSAYSGNARESIASATSYAKTEDIQQIGQTIQPCNKQEGGQTVTLLLLLNTSTMHVEQ